MATGSVDALVLRAAERGENDKLLTLLSAEGKFYAILKQAHEMTRREAASTEPYTWSNFEFYEKNEVRWVKNATGIEAFPGIRTDIDKLFLAAYFCEVAEDLSGEKEPAGEILPLTLNALHLLSTGKVDILRVKAVFEMRAAAVSGFYPDLSACEKCVKTFGQNGGYLDVMNGSLICNECFHKAEQLAPLPEVNEMGERRVLCPLEPAAAAALRYVCEAEPKRVFSFDISSEMAEKDFEKAAESYLLHHLERNFPTLDNFKKMQVVRKPKANKTSGNSAN